MGILTALLFLSAVAATACEPYVCKPTHHVGRDAAAGSTVVGHNSTVDDLLRGNTSCEDPRDKSAYLVPDRPDCMVNDSLGVKSVAVEYHNNGVAKMPNGMKILVSDCSDIYWEVSGGGLRLKATLPTCWDGIHLDTVNHADHVRYEESNGSCPSCHPVKIPRVSLDVAYNHTRVPEAEPTAFYFAAWVDPPAPSPSSAPGPRWPWRPLLASPPPPAPPAPRPVPATPWPAPRPARATPRSSRATPRRPPAVPRIAPYSPAGAPYSPAGAPYSPGGAPYSPAGGPDSPAGAPYSPAGGPSSCHSTKAFTDCMCTCKVPC